MAALLWYSLFHALEESQASGLPLQTQIFPSSLLPHTAQLTFFSQITENTKELSDVFSSKKNKGICFS